MLAQFLGGIDLITSKIVDFDYFTPNMDSKKRVAQFLGIILITSKITKFDCFVVNMDSKYVAQILGMILTKILGVREKKLAGGLLPPKFCPPKSCGQKYSGQNFSGQRSGGHVSNGQK